jgi:type I restriction enzyme R subunit
MLDTGIDVPEIVNLVFFKEVRSKTKFWQMIGRGTRLCSDLDVLDAKDGAYSGKRRFFIFDYLGNFEFFREHKEGFASNDTMALSEFIFVRRVRLIRRFQESAFVEEEWQRWRAELVEICVNQVKSLNPELVSVRLQRRHVEKFSNPEAYQCLNEADMNDLEKTIAPLVFMDETDEFAKRFDNFMYGLILQKLDALPGYMRAQRQLCITAQCLEKRATIPQVLEKLPIIRMISTDEFWAAGDVLAFENIRRELRELIKFIADEGSARIVYTMLTDEVMGTQEGKPLDPAYDFSDYRLKVNRYIEENRNHITIHKLRNNIPLTETDYQALSDILTKELGSEDDYRREFGDTPMGLLVRKVAHLDHDAAMQAFSIFINDQSLNQQQIVFVKKIIDYVEQNGYVEDTEVLLSPPFDKPMGFFKLFDEKRRQRIVETIDRIKMNAVIGY